MAASRVGVKGRLTGALPFRVAPEEFPGFVTVGDFLVAAALTLAGDANTRPAETGLVSWVVVPPKTKGFLFVALLSAFADGAAEGGEFSALESFLFRPVVRVMLVQVCLKSTNRISHPLVWLA